MQLKGNLRLTNQGVPVVAQWKKKKLTNQSKRMCFSWIATKSLCVCVCVCERERETEREGERGRWEMMIEEM